MATGVRSYGNSLHMQNIFDPDKLPDVIPEVKAFASRILRPVFKCVEVDCGTKIGRRIDIPEVDAVGLIDLHTNEYIRHEDIVHYLDSGIYNIRVRDTVSCLSNRGFCAKCGNGFFAREGERVDTGPGNEYMLKTSPRSYQNYVASTFSGSLFGFSTLTASPLPAPPYAWDLLTTHREMDRLCDKMKAININVDEMEYMYSVEDILERALLIIGMYGVYGYAKH